MTLNHYSIAELDSVTPAEVEKLFVVGIDREARKLGMSIDEYVRKIVEALQSTDISEPLKTQILSGIDNIAYRGLSVVMIHVPPQKRVSFIGNKAFQRRGPSTVEVKGQELVAVSKQFPQ